MVEKIKDILNVKTVASAAFLIAFFSLISQITALFRDRFLASKFGPGEVLDIYYSAFNVPDIIYALLFSLTSAVTIVPILTKAVEKQNWDKAHKIFSTFLNVFFVFTIPICIIIYFLLPHIVPLYTSGYDKDLQENIIMLARIILLQPIFLGVSSLISSLAQTENKFLAFSLAPIMYNFGIIFGIIFFYDIYGIAGLGYGVILGAILHLLTQSFSLVKEWHHGDFLYEFHIEWREVMALMKLSYLRVIGLFILQTRAVALVFFASSLGVGALSIFKMSHNLSEVFFSLITISYTIAAFPVLSKAHEDKNEEIFDEAVIRGVRHLLFFLFPIVTYIILMRAHIIRIVLGTGHISWEDTKILALSFMILILILIIQSIIYFFGRICYAKRNSFIPFLSQLISVSFLIFFIYFTQKHIGAIYGNYKNIFDYVFYLLKVPEINSLEKVKLIILPLSYALVFIVEFFVMVFFVQKKKIFDLKKLSLVYKTFFDSIFASIFLFVFIYLLLRFFEPLLGVNIAGNVTFPGLLLQTIFTSVFGFLIWYGVLKYRKSEEINHFESLIKNKIWKSKIESEVNLGEMRG